MEDQATVEIEKVEQKEDVIQIQNDVVISVSFSSTFTAVTTFFTGLLITKYTNLDPSMDIPILFLIISTFGFLYATLIYSNSSGLIIHSRVTRSKHSIKLGNVLSEYVGVYFLVLSIPLIINVVTKDSFLQFATALVDMAGLFVYHVSEFTIMSRNFHKFHFTFLFFIYILEGLLLMTQFSNRLFFELISTILIIFLFTLTYRAIQEGKENLSA